MTKRGLLLVLTLVLTGSPSLLRAEDYPCETFYTALGDGSFAWWNSCSGQVGDPIWPRPSKDVLLDVLHHDPKLLIVLKTEADILRIAATPEVQELFRAALKSGGIVLTTKQPVNATARKFTGTPSVVIGSTRQGFYLAALPDARDPNHARAFARDLSSVVGAMTGVPQITIDEGTTTSGSLPSEPTGFPDGVCCDTSTGGANAPTDAGTPGSPGVGGGVSGSGGEGGGDG